MQHWAEMGLTLSLPYHIETHPLTCIANQRTGFYMIGLSVMNDLMS